MTVISPNYCMKAVFASMLLLILSNANATECLASGEQACKIFLNDNLPSGKSYQLVIDVQVFDSVGMVNDSVSGYWGQSGKLPSTHISEINLNLGNQKVSIPGKVINDMGNVFHAEMKENEHAVVMLIKGGSGSDAYYATYVIIDGVLRKRTVRSNEAPDQYWEKTTFKSPAPVQSF